MSTLNELSLYELQELRNKEQFSTAELLRDCMERIRAREPDVQAFEHIDLQRDFSAADVNGQSAFGAGLEGIPFGVKDIMDTHDMPTGWGSPIYAGSQPSRDAGCVAALRGTGAIALGKTVTTEFAYFYPGKTHNPHNLQHTPGGSSQGSAAAVADYMVTFALGTQTAASVIRPAAYCGVVGYKSSHGEFDLGGVCSLSQSMDSLGFFTRDARDLAIIRAALLARTPTVPLTRPEKMAIVRTPHWREVDESSRELLERCAAALQSEGVIVEELDIGPDDGALTEAQKTVMAFEAARSRYFEYRHFRDQVSPQMQSLIESGLAIAHTSYTDAQSLARKWRETLATRYAGYDCFLTPSAIGEAPVGLDSTGDPLFSRMWNLLGGPSVNLPAGSGPGGLPLGIQLVGHHGKDDELIARACWIQSVVAA